MTTPKKPKPLPAFMADSVVAIHLADNTGTRSDCRLVVTNYVKHHDEVRRLAVAEANYRLSQLGVPKESLDGAYLEVIDTSYTAANPKGVRRDPCEQVVAFSDVWDKTTPKLRAIYIRQNRLVPENLGAALMIYGSPEQRQAQAEHDRFCSNCLHHSIDADKPGLIRCDSPLNTRTPGDVAHKVRWATDSFCGSVGNGFYWKELPAETATQAAEQVAA